MRNVFVLVTAGLLTVASLLIVPPTVTPGRSAQIQDQPTEVAARYHYRNRRGKIYRRYIGFLESDFKSQTNCQAVSGIGSAWIGNKLEVRLHDNRLSQLTEIVELDDRFVGMS